MQLDNNNAPQEVLHMGVRIFSDGREAKTKTSLAVGRREARGMRRRRDRLVRRQQELMEELIACGLMPKDETARKALEVTDPYALRAKGLDEKLTPYELGRALFHINQRRGFKSNRKQSTKENEAGAIIEATKRLAALLQETGARTYGEFLYKSAVKRVRNTSAVATKTIYDFYPQRHMLEAEYDALLAVQKQYHADMLTSQTVASLRKTIFFQRPLRPVQKGRCSLMPDKERAYAALPSSQRFRILKEVNNLEILSNLRRNRDDLTSEQRAIILKELYKTKNPSFDGLRKKLKLDSAFAFNLESEHRDKIGGATTHITMVDKKCFGALWEQLSLQQQDDVVTHILEAEEDNALSDWLHQTHPSLTNEQIEEIMDVPLETGVLRYSTEAIHELLPYLEEGENEHEAREACRAKGLFSSARGYTGEIKTELPYYGELLETHVAFGTGNLEHSEEKCYGKIPNPTVHIALNQIRRVVNELIKEFGTPAEIAIELARDLKLNKKEKQRLIADIAKNTKENEVFDSQIRAAGQTPSNERRLRLKLHKQQNKLCAYSGNPIELTELLSDEGKVEIDHILPFSRTLDDTSANKVVVFREQNRIKGNRSPYEAFSGNADYEEMLARVQSYPNSKKWRFLQDAMKKFEEDNGWLARQLTDTSYMARVAREYLRYATAGNVDTYPGGMTAKLRRAWGLNSHLSDDNNHKNRDDHRHHAIDALVIACANRSMLNAISKASGKGQGDGDVFKDIPVPYARYNRVALQAMVDNIIISHKPDHGSPGQNGSTSGRLHEDTFYGKTRNQGKIGEREAPKKGQIRLHVREMLTSLKEKDIADIVDDILRRKVAEAMGNRGDKKYEEAIAEFARANNIRRVRVFVEKSETAMKEFRDKSGKPYRYVATGGNHHIDIFCPIKDRTAEDGTHYKAGKWYAETVSTFDANQKGFEPQWRKEHPTAKLVMRLHINDMVAYEEKGETEIRRVKKIDATSDRVYLVSHLVANEKADTLSWAASANLLQSKNARKIAVTASGKVLDPGKAPMPKPFRESA